jgi:hypothetical protein
MGSSNTHIQASPLVSSKMAIRIKLTPKSALSLPGFDAVFYKFRFEAHLADYNPFISNQNPNSYPPRLFTTPLSSAASQKIGFTPLHSPYITTAEIPFILTPKMLGNAFSSEFDTHQYNYYPSSSPLHGNIMKVYYGYETSLRLHATTIKPWLALHQRYGLLMSDKSLQAKVRSVMGIGQINSKKIGKSDEKIKNHQEKNKNGELLNTVICSVDMINNNKTISKHLNRMVKNSKQTHTNGGNNGTSLGLTKNISYGSVTSYLIGTEYDNNDYNEDDYDYNDDENYCYDFNLDDNGEGEGGDWLDHDFVGDGSDTE